MEDYESDNVLAELARLCDEMGLEHTDSEAMACKTHIFVDASGNPHECWEAGPGFINVTVAMTPRQAVRITDVMAENRKLRAERDHMWALRDTWQENDAKLREENERLQSVVSDGADNARELRAENAKLQKLVIDFDKCLDTAMYLAGVNGFATMPNQELFDSLRPRMQELGVEL